MEIKWIKGTLNKKGSFHTYASSTVMGFNFNSDDKKYYIKHHNGSSIEVSMGFISLEYIHPDGSSSQVVAHDTEVVPIKET